MKVQNDTTRHTFPTVSSESPEKYHIQLLLLIYKTPQNVVGHFTFCLSMQFLKNHSD
jgi:hypothetical protein